MLGEAHPTRRRWLATGLAAAASLGCPAVLRGQEALTLRLGHGLPASHPVHPAMEFFAERIRERTAGAIRVSIFPDGQLGQEVNLVGQLKAGSLDLVKASASVLERASPAYRLFNMPYLFRDRAHWQAVAKGPIGAGILASGERDGLIGLTFYEAGSRSFYAREAIDHPDALRGLKIRIQPSPTMQRLVETFGATPVQMSWEVVYSALQFGLVDGAENSIAALIFGRHGEVVRYYSFDEHTMVPDVLLISAKRWDSLSPAHREIVRDSARESFGHMNDLWAAFESTARGRIQDMGVTFTRPDKAPFAERARPIGREFEEDDTLSDLVRAIQAA